MKLSKDPEITAAMKSCTTHFIFAGVFSFVANILLFAFPLYMLNVYSRVLTSRSFETLVVLFVGLVVAIVFKTIFNWLRSALLVRSAVRLDRRLAARIVEALFERRAGGRADIGSQALRDLDAFRYYVSGAGGSAVIDSPWGALFLGALLVLNPAMGITALVSIVVIAGLTVADVMVTRAGIAKSDRESLNSYVFIESNLPSAEAVVGMGMLSTLVGKWQGVREPALASQVFASYRGGGFDGAIAAIRYIAQGVFVAVGVIEVLAGATTSGVLIASMFMFQFAMSPFTGLIRAWSGLTPVKLGLQRLEKVLQSSPPRPERMVMPKPAGELAVRNLGFAVQGQEKPILRNVSFGVAAGVSLGVVGLIGSGKTTLARLLVGAFKPTTGSVRVDDHEVWGWVRGNGGTHVGYVPQNVGLLAGTVADNIGRFGSFNEFEIVAAAQMAGAHELIMRLPLGYDTVIGEGGHPISGGQKQLIALARAVVGIPSVVVLDEPNSNLDGPGEDALMGCIAKLKELKSTVVLISHRPNLVRQLDKILLLKDGQLVGFGDAEHVSQQLGRPMVVRRAAPDDKVARLTQMASARNGTEA